MCMARLETVCCITNATWDRDLFHLNDVRISHLALRTRRYTRICHLYVLLTTIDVLQCGHVATLHLRSCSWTDSSLDPIKAGTFIKGCHSKLAVFCENGKHPFVTV